MTFVVVLRLGDKQRAIADFDQAIKLKPDNIEAYIWRGITYSELGDKRRAITDYDRAIELDTTNIVAYYNRASVNSPMPWTRPAAR